MGYVIGIVALIIAISGIYRMITQFYYDLPSRWRIFSGALRVAASAVLIVLFSSHFATGLVFAWLIVAAVAIVIAEGYALIFTE